MKPLPPIPPNCPRFHLIDKPRMAPVRVGDILWECYGVCIKLNVDDPNISNWRGVIAADAEVAWRKEVLMLCEELYRIPQNFNMIASAKMVLVRNAHNAAAAWRSWGEPEPESEDTDNATT